MEASAAKAAMAQTARLFTRDFCVGCMESLESGWRCSGTTAESVFIFGQTRRLRKAIGGRLRKTTELNRGQRTWGWGLAHRSVASWQTPGTKAFKVGELSALVVGESVAVAGVLWRKGVLRALGLKAFLDFAALAVNFFRAKRLAHGKSDQRGNRENRAKQE